MKKVIYISLFLFGLIPKILFAQLLQNSKIDWANSFGNNKDNKVIKSTTDKEGNSYVVYTFQENIKINSLSKEFESRGNTDLILVKYNTNGIILNAVNLGGEGMELVNDLKVVEDKIYMAGAFEKSMYWANSKNVLARSEGDLDMFWARLSSNLDLEQIFHYGGIYEDEIYQIHIYNQEVIISGYYRNTIDLAPLQEGFDFQTKGYSDAFIAKYTLNGECIWANAINLVSVTTTLNTAIDKEGNIYCAGVFQATCDFDPSVNQYFLTSVQNSSDVFISKYSPKGNFIFAYKFGGRGREQLYDMVINHQDEIILTGYFQGNVNFDVVSNSSKFSISTFTQNGFIVAYKPKAEIVFVNKFEATSGLEALKIAVDANDNIYLGGTYFGNANFNYPEVSTNLIYSKGNSDIFIAQYNSSGRLLNVFSLGEENSEVLQGLHCNQQKVFVGGSFDARNITFSTLKNEVNLNGNGNQEAFWLAINNQGSDATLFKLSGRINGENKTSEKARVTLFRKENNSVIKVSSQESLDNGQFLFANLLPGDYTLMASPQKSNNYITTYYVNKEHIEEANWINLFGNTSELDLQLMPVPATLRNTNKGQWVSAYLDNTTQNLKINISAEYTKDLSCELSVFSVSGQKVFKRQFHAQDFGFECSMILPSELPGGIYWAVIENSNYSLYTYKFLK